MVHKGKFLFMDTETGGIDPETTSLLTACFVIAEYKNKRFEIFEDLKLTLKPDDGIYKVTKYSLDVNKICIPTHDEYAMTYSDAAHQLGCLLESEFGDQQKYIPVGYAIEFDIKFIKKFIISSDDYDHYISIHPIDCHIIANMLFQLGMMHGVTSIKLSELAAFFGVDATGIHSAANDVLITMNILEKIFSYLKDDDVEKMMNDNR